MGSAWPSAELRQVVQLDLDKVQVDPAATYDMVGVLSFGKGLFHREPVSGNNTSYKYFYRLKEDHVVMSQLFGWEGALALSASEFAGKFLSPQFPTFVCDQRVLDRRYLGWFIRRPVFWEELGKRAKGMGDRRRTLNPESLLSCYVPLPPISEQGRIVTKIDELAVKIGEAHGLQQRTIEDAWTLLESTRANIFKKMSSSWKLQKLDEVAPINMGQSPPGESYNTFGDGIPLLNGPTEFGEKYPTPVQWTTAPTKLCKPGDILLCVRGATTGRLNWADKEYCIGRGLAALTLKSEVCVPEYVYYFVETQTQEMLGLAAGSTFPNLPGAKLKVLEIPVPPILEQRRVVAYLDSIQEKITPLRDLQSQTSAELEALLPSILDKAFKGEL